MIKFFLPALMLMAIFLAGCTAKTEPTTDPPTPTPVVRVTPKVTDNEKSPDVAKFVKVTILVDGMSEKLNLV